MSAPVAELEELCKRLSEKGVSAFAPSTLSCEPKTLDETVGRLGEFIRRFHQNRVQGAIPVGIHIEGPFINAKAAGAHPEGILRPATLSELEQLWLSSQKTLKIITLAPEIHAPKEFRSIVAWAQKRSIRLSLGHSAASSHQAAEAFQQGMNSVTHAWNAMPFHHRNPGALGAALGRKDLFLELIVDGVHVDHDLAQKTCALHELTGGKVCLVSDCAPAAGLPHGHRSAFGDLVVQSTAKGCLVVNDLGQAAGLAGSALLLPQATEAWLNHRFKTEPAPLSGSKLAQVLKKAWLYPMESIGSPFSQKQLRSVVELQWVIDSRSKKIKCKTR